MNPRTNTDFSKALAEDARRFEHQVAWRRIFYQFETEEVAKYMIGRMETFRGTNFKEGYLKGLEDKAIASLDSSGKKAEPQFQAAMIPVSEVPDFGANGQWGMARFYRKHLRKLEAGRAVCFEFHNEKAFELGRWGIKTAARSIFGQGRTRVRSDREMLRFYVWLREQPNPEHMPDGVSVQREQGATG